MKGCKACVKFGSVEKEEEWVIAHFLFSVAIKIVDFVLQQQVHYRDKVEYWQAS